uniref:calvin cycle protein CP12-3, chloroplastic-like isoform X2 n=1 Tax=Erigeron canadensis TaxID=72917 RepID=UPI001CB88F5B|nr:calvin cycle protein CP12-3, chloroplastic-like isoform X2 [Erigeron canadensis]
MLVGYIHIRMPRSITEVNSVKSCSLLGYKLFTSSSSVCFSGQKKGLSGVGLKAMFKGTHVREMKLTEMIENKVTEAKEVCAGDKDSDECKVAWDEVEEISQAKAHLRVKLEHDEDPLDSFCSGNPETDECSVYDD